MTFCRARYLTPDREGNTRAQRNEHFGVDATPDWNVPTGGQYLLDWFDELSAGHNRIVQRHVLRVEWSAIQAWQQLLDVHIYPHEIAILRAMDTAYCEALETELEYHSAKAQQAAEAEAAAKAKSRGR